MFQNISGYTITRAAVNVLTLCANYLIRPLLLGQYSPVAGMLTRLTNERTHKTKFATKNSSYPACTVVRVQNQHFHMSMYSYRFCRPLGALAGFFLKYRFQCVVLSDRVLLEHTRSPSTPMSCKIRVSLKPGLAARFTEATARV